MKKNILVIDDSALMRRVLSDIIESDDRFMVADVANNGLDALNILQKKADEIDAILLDINMPRMNGLEFLTELKKQNISATVIVVSTVAKKDAKVTILALELGAIDFVTKPESFIEVKNNLFSNRILECLAVATMVHPTAKMTTLPELEDIKPKPEVTRRVKRSITGQGDGKLVAIACSTGGPKALHSVITALPENLDASVIIVQHMPEGFTKSLADRLNDLSKIHVKEAEDGDILSKGTVYLAKGGHMLRVWKNQSNQYQIAITKETARRGLLPCADVMYESLVEADFSNITCVVLTGMGSDGTAGIRELENNKKNIYVIAQNEESCIVYGMPKAIAQAGLVDEVAALTEVSEAITRNVGVQ